MINPKSRFFLAYFGLILGFAVLPSAANAGIVYSNIANSTGFYTKFNGAAQVGANLATNVDLNDLTLAPGSQGQSITSLSVIVADANTVAVTARPTTSVWDANGTGNLPGTFLGSFILPDQTFTTFSTTIGVNIPTGTLVIPSDDHIWVGLGFDNDNGKTNITAAQLDLLGAVNYHPATIGIDGPQSYFFGPSSNMGVSNPSVTPYGGLNGGSYGWVVTAAAVPEPTSLLMTGGAMGIVALARRPCRKAKGTPRKMA